MTPDSLTRKTWQDIARDIEQERSPLKIRALAHELNEAMPDEERRKVAQRIESPHHEGNFFCRKDDALAMVSMWHENT
jgi:hypothetical protein